MSNEFQTYVKSTERIEVGISLGAMFGGCGHAR